MSDFNNKNVLITGAASGIGRLLALKAAQLGGHSILWDMNEQGLNEISSEIREGDHNVSTYVCDLSDRDSIGLATESVLEEHGHVDILINNAGIVSGKQLQDISDEEILRTFEVNALAPIWTTRAFLPSMIEEGSGHIVSIGSAGGLVGTARLTDYSASKFAVFGFDEALRLELKHLNVPIRTTIICPFYVDTGMFEGVSTRFPWILPILKPDYVAGKIIKAIQTNRKRLVMPRLVSVVFPARLLPVTVFDWMLGFLGVTKTMDEFEGRSKT